MSTDTFIASSNHFAMRISQRVANDILRERKYAPLRKHIRSLFVDESMPQTHIALELRNTPPLNDARLISIETVASVVRFVVSALVDDDLRTDIIYENQLIHLQNCKDAALIARMESWKKRGHFVFEIEENKYFWNTVLLDPSCKRGNVRFNHEKVAAKMNEKYPGRNFTSQVCGNKYMLRRGVPKGHALSRDTKA